MTPLQQSFLLTLTVVPVCLIGIWLIYRWLERGVREQRERREEWLRQLSDRLTAQSSNSAYVQAFNNLGLYDGKPVSRERVKQAYRKLAKVHHPDRGGNPTNWKVLQDSRDLAMHYIEENGG